MSKFLNKWSLNFKDKNIEFKFRKDLMENSWKIF
jgi:hypothetical protein